MLSAYLVIIKGVKILQDTTQNTQHTLPLPEPRLKTEHSGSEYCCRHETGNDAFGLRRAG